MKRPQPKFHADTMSHSKVIKSKKWKFIIRSKFIVRSNLSLRQNFLATEFLSLWIFH